MASSGRFRLTDILKALEECLPGCRVETKLHNLWVYPPGGGEPFRLPKGGHGEGYRAEIQRGHVKGMARQFGVLECMQQKLRGL